MIGAKDGITVTGKMHACCFVGCEGVESLDLLPEGFNYHIHMRLLNKSFDLCQEGKHLLLMLHCFSLTRFRVQLVTEGQYGIFLKEHHVGRPSEDEVADVVALGNSVSLLLGTLDS